MATKCKRCDMRVGSQNYMPMEAFYEDKDDPSKFMVLCQKCGEEYSHEQKVLRWYKTKEKLIAEGKLKG